MVKGSDGPIADDHHGVALAHGGLVTKQREGMVLDVDAGLTVSAAIGVDDRVGALAVHRATPRGIGSGLGRQAASAAISS